MRRILFILIIFSFTQVFAQNYQELSVRDIQFISTDSLNTDPFDYPSVFNGDTVVITGVVMNAPFRYDDPTIATLHVGGAGFFIRDTSGAEFSGIIVRQNSITSTSFSAVDTAMVVRVTGVVSEYFTTTQFNLIKFDPEDVVDFKSKRPDPIKLSISDFVKPDGAPNYVMEKYEGMYVEISNVTVTDEISIGSGSFGIFDENNLRMMVGNQSDYIRNSIPTPLAGTRIEYIRGFIETRTNIAPEWFMIDPVYANDIKYGSVLPPRISNVERDVAIVAPNQSTNITAKVADSDGSIKEAWLIYRVNFGAPDSVAMNPVSTGDSIYTAAIPALSDTGFIDYYIRAVDDMDLNTTNPSNLASNRYFFPVIDHDPTIQDVQYSPFGSGFSGFHNFNISLRGIVTADTSDLGNLVYIQNGTGPWSGIQIFGTEPLKLKKGDDVTITGYINEMFGITRLEGIDDPAQIVINATGADVPAPTVLSTDVIDLSNSGELPAEAYESVLVEYDNVNVTDDNADGETGPDQGSGGNRNFGEMLVADGSNIEARVETQDGNHPYNNFWDPAQENDPFRIKTGDHFDALVGILYYSFGNFKLIPRNINDFIGFTEVKQISEVLPEKYELSQNYPNPFNPTTIIRYSLPAAGYVTLKVYDALGREITTLINDYQNVGSYRVNFNAASLASGLYFYRITSGNFTSVKKMALIK